MVSCKIFQIRSEPFARVATPEVTHAQHMTACKHISIGTPIEVAGRRSPWKAFGTTRQRVCWSREYCDDKNVLKVMTDLFIRIGAPECYRPSWKTRLCYTRRKRRDNKRLLYCSLGTHQVIMTRSLRRVSKRTQVTLINLRLVQLRIASRGVEAMSRPAKVVSSRYLSRSLRMSARGKAKERWSSTVIRFPVSYCTSVMGAIFASASASDS